MRRSSGVRPDLVEIGLQLRLTLPSVSSNTIPQKEGSLIWDSRRKALYISNGIEWEYIPPGSLSIQDLYSVLSVGNFTGGLSIDLTDGGKIISSNSDIELNSTLSSGSGDILLYPKGEVVTTGDIDLTQASALISTDGDIVIDGTVSSGSGKIFLNPKGGENGIVIINGSLDVIGTTTSIETQTLLVKNNRVYLNAGNISTTPLAGYVVVNYLATSNFSLITGSFTNGGVGGPTVQTSGSYSFVAGDIIQISSAHNPDNNGLFEVNSDVGGLITIRGVGGVTPTFSMFQNNFVADAVAGGRVTLVNVGVASASSTGLWQTNTPGSSTVGMTFRNLATQLQNSGTGTYSLIYNVSTSTLKMLSSGSGVSIVDSGTGNLTISSSGLNTLSNEGGGARVYDDVASTSTNALLRTLLGTSNGLTVTQGLTTITIDNTLTANNLGSGSGTLFSAKSGATLEFNTLAGTSNGLTVSAPSSNVITIDNTLTGSNLGSGTGLFVDKTGASLRFNSLTNGSGISLAVASNTITISNSGVNTIANEGGGSQIYDTTTSTSTSALLRTLTNGSGGISLSQGLTTITIDNTLTGSNVGVGTGTLFSAKSGATLQFNTLAGTSNGLTVSAPSSNVITIDNTLTGGNVGVGTGTVFSAKSGATLQFNTLAGTSNGLTVSAPSSNVITIDNTLTCTNLGSGSQIFSAKSGANLQLRSLTAGSNISLTQNANDISIASSLTKDFWIFITSTAHGVAATAYLGTCIFDNTTEALVSTSTPVAGTLTYVQVSITNTRASNITSTLYINGVNSGNVITILAGTSFASTTLSIPVAVNDRFSLLVSAPNPGGNAYCGWLRIVY
jgi:hypothetical protein